ncbi:uncharacterized protein LOC124139531 [Haliotis rufescens]|uniref:uncharacterized protein LOC124139531 n=1 Tax=Haliotis rufescens TaxID=6454 RepID=UPI001EB08BA7|nr:uncharacterized protein LOC124139531 [Haliotis rufescens]
MQQQRYKCLDFDNPRQSMDIPDSISERDYQPSITRSGIDRNSKFMIDRPQVYQPHEQIPSHQVYRNDSNVDLRVGRKVNDDFSEVNLRRGTFHSDQHSENGKRLSNLTSISLRDSFMDTYSELPELCFAPMGDVRSSVGNASLTEGNWDHSKIEDVPASNSVNILRIIAIVFILWDVVADWWMVGVFDNYACWANPQFHYKFYKLDICGVHRENIRQVLAVFTILGSIFSLIQIINIILSILRDRGVVRLQLFKPLTEVYIAVFFEEIPQAVTLLVFNYNCKCTREAAMFSLIMMVSGLASTVLRYAACFPSISSEHGCCNTWWRCCCCKSRESLCRLTGQDCFCRCSIPCPLCCCTLQCDDCNWMPHTWMESLYEALSCFCSCCYRTEASYGLRMMDNLGILFLMFCLVAKIVVLTVT